MSANKSEKKKRHLGHARRKNRRAPVWLTLRTGDRSMIRGSKRNWRHQKLTRKMKRLLKD
ncbi:50S ribosomal protein L39e [archaeon]|nr:50S ribosomal protein L39e [archaeon]